MKEITDLIPQREPFLFVDKILKKEEGYILTEKNLTGDEDFFKGHFPSNPIMPGVLIQEAAFQTGALLMAKEGESSGLGVVTKVEKARFKDFVRPKDTMTIEVKLVEKISNAFYMQGKVRVKEKVVASINFTCASVEESK